MGVLYVNCPHCEGHIRVNLTVRDPTTMKPARRKRKRLPNPDSYQFWAETVLEVIKNHPGLSRSGIVTEIDQENFTSRAYMNCVTSLRRRGEIENRGTKKYPEWYVKETHENY